MRIKRIALKHPDNIPVSGIQVVELLFIQQNCPARDAIQTGERVHGTARHLNLNSFIYLYIGTGLGAGIFTDGHIYTGHAHNAGEIGHIVVEPGGRDCYCGNQGCLERYVSLQAAYEFCGLDPKRALPEDLLQIEPARFLAWIESVTTPLRQAINILESVFDAEAVIIGGMMPAPLLEQMDARLPPLYQSVRGRYLLDMRLKRGMTGSDTAALGAAALPIFDEFNPKFQVLMKWARKGRCYLQQRPKH